MLTPLLLDAVVEWVLARLASLVGLNGLAIGTVATIIVVSYYAREASGVLVVTARYVRVVTWLLVAVLVVLVVGTGTGMLDLDAGGSVIGSVVRSLREVLS